MDNLYTHQIIPGILEKGWVEIEKKVELIKTFSKKIHIDVIDGKFAPNQTFLDPAPFLKYANELYLEAHLMVEEPISYLDSFAKAGFRKFIGHIEKMTSQEEFVAKGELLGEVGLGLDLDTPVESITSSFEDLDSVLLMAVKAGESGQTFDPKVLEKIKNLRSKTFIPIEVDGGINDQTIVGCKDAGANIFVSTSYITGSEKPLDQYEKLQKLLQT
ncbi:MAG TPA: hypothetical protein VKC89_01755 [Patescibacteria group bacterium]|nr:hypothetical protein [Patescibacteria group bacterium]